MASQLREVLNQFEVQREPVSVRAMARHMEINPNVLQGMIDYWVRKGKLRATSSSGEMCTTCGDQPTCPFVVHMPDYYELARDESENAPPPSCTCCR